MAMMDHKQRAGRHTIPIEVERAYAPNHGAMLQSLRVILGMPKVPIALTKGEKETSFADVLAQ